MMNKTLALAGLLGLAGSLAAAQVVGCGGSDDNGSPSADAGKDGKVMLKPEAGALPEEETVGKACTTTADCNVTGSKNDNICSAGAYGMSGGSDIFGSPVCIQVGCTYDPVNLGANFCDSNGTNTPGYCYQNGTNTECRPACQYDSNTITTPCQGTGNVCHASDFGRDTTTNAVSAIGTCSGGCTKDSECTGAGQKCQVEFGFCVASASFQTFPKKIGQPCMAGGETDECACIALPDGADKNKGVCSFSCVTGAAGDTACQAAATASSDAGSTGQAWKCTAGLSARDNKDAGAFTGNPDGVYGSCFPTCTVDADCQSIGGSLGLTTGKYSCSDNLAGGKYCVLQY